jgi:hypothetical protein
MISKHRKDVKNGDKSWFEALSPEYLWRAEDNDENLSLRTPQIRYRSARSWRVAFRSSVKCEYDGEQSGSMKRVEFLDKLNEVLLHKVSWLVSRHYRKSVNVVLTFHYQNTNVTHYDRIQSEFRTHKSSPAFQSRIKPAGGFAQKYDVQQLSVQDLDINALPFSRTFPSKYMTRCHLSHTMICDVFQ